MKSILRLLSLLSGVLALVPGQPGPAVAQGPDLFKGATINLLVGFGPGGGNDVWARAISRHLGRNLPGNPTIVMSHMPGAGGLTLANQLASVSPKDGTVIALINRGIPLEPLLGGQGANFDAQKLTYIGSPDKDITVCAARKDAPVQVMQDLFTKELIVGGTGSGADTAIYPDFLRELTGMRFKTVKGYKGSNDIMLAMERGEVQGICLANDSLARSNLAREGKLNILFQAALKPDPRLKDVPVGTDIARSAEERQALELFFTRVALGRPFVAPPGMAPERANALRRGFDATMKDKAFLEEAAQQKLTIEPITGEELAGLVAAAYRTPAETVKRTAEALGRASRDDTKPGKAGGAQ